MADIMINATIKLIALFYVAINVNSGTIDSSGAVVDSISLLVDLHGGCNADIQGISYAIRSVITGLCNCTIISSSLDCCSDDYIVYQFNISHSRSPVVTPTVNDVIISDVIINSSIYSTDGGIKLQHCYYGNCTCDGDSGSGDSRHIVLILEIVCGSLLILVLMTLFIVCYKSYRLHHQRRTVKEMTKAPPIPSPRQIQLPSQLISTCEYIAPEDVASPTFSPTLHHSNRCCMHDATVRGLTGRSAVMELNATGIQEVNVECNINSTRTSTAQMHTSIAHSNTTSNHDGRSSSQLHGIVSTASGLIAVIGLNDTIATDDVIPSQKHPGYVEHKINHVHSNNV